MTYNVVLTQGTTLTFNSSLVSGVVGIKGIGSGKATEINVTTLASTAKEFRQGLQDFGTITIDLIRSEDDAGQQALATALAAQTNETCVIVLPSGTVKTGTFTCFVTRLQSDVDADGVVKGSVDLRVTGPIVWS